MQSMNESVTAERRAPRIDLVLLWFVLVPAFTAAAGFYWAGAFWPSVVTACVPLCVVVIIAPEVGFYIYFAWQALDVMFLTQAQTIMTPGKGLAVLLVAVYIIRPGRARVPLLVSKSFIGGGLLLGTYGLLTALFAIQPTTALRFGGQIVVQVLLASMAIHTLSERTYIRRALSFTVCGGIIAALAMLSGGVSEQFRRGTLGQFANPNTTALGLSVALACVPAAWAYNRNKLLYIIYALAVPLILAAILKTGSRAAVMAIIGSIVLSVVLTRNAPAPRRIAVLVVGLVVTIASIVYVVRADILTPESQDRFQQLVEGHPRFGEESRLYIWGLVLRAYLSQVWGFGFGNTAWAVSEREGVYVDAHSSYLGTLVDGGPISLALFLFCLWQLVKCSWRIPRGAPGIASAILASLVILSGVTHTVHFTKWFWIPATLCLLLAEQAERERREQELLPVLPDSLGIYAYPRKRRHGIGTLHGR